MSIFKNIIGVILISMFMYGCAATPITQQQVKVQTAMEKAEIACYKQLTAHDVAMMEAMGRIPKDQIAFVMMMVQMSDANKETMAIATGNSYNPCGSGTSVFDVQIAELKEKNRMVSETSNNAWNLGKWVVGAWGISEILDKTAAQGISYVASGNGKLNVNSQNAGSFNDVDGNDFNNNMGGTTYNDNSSNNKDVENADNSNGNGEEGNEFVGRCRTDSSCPDGYVCSRHDGEVGECIAASSE